jgi:hypothetical protein
MTAAVLRETQRYGIFANPRAVTTLTFQFAGKPWYHTMARTAAPQGRVIVEKIIFKSAARSAGSS